MLGPTLDASFVRVRPSAAIVRPSIAPPHATGSIAIAGGGGGKGARARKASTTEAAEEAAATPEAILVAHAATAPNPGGRRHRGLRQRATGATGR